jgi:hypothetical protein
MSFPACFSAAEISLRGTLTAVVVGCSVAVCWLFTVIADSGLIDVSQ